MDEQKMKSNTDMDSDITDRYDIIISSINIINYFIHLFFLQSGQKL